MRTFTANAVVVPPSPAGPMPVEFIFSSISFSKSDTQDALEELSPPTGSVRACFAIRAAFSKVPPIPTPTIIGGQAFGPASVTAFKIASFIKGKTPEEVNQEFIIECQLTQEEARQLGLEQN